MITSAKLRDRLGILHQRTAESPLFNPVFQLSLDLSRDLEAGRLSLAEAGGLAAELGCESLLDRANRLVNLLAPMGIPENRAAFADLASAADFEEFARRWSHPLFHIVFTAHPTFLLTRSQSDAVADAASQGAVTEAVVCTVETERTAITLDFEHDEALAALGRAQDARDILNGLLLEAAAMRWPERWRELRPLPYRFATWVGYDMDGRTDIGWPTCVHYRLGEKALRLERYAAKLEGIDPGNRVLSELRAAAAHAREMETLFAGDLTAPADLSDAANRLTADHPAKLVSLTPLIAALENAAVAADDETARGLLILAAAMRADGLGMGGIHFRVNSSQLRNAIRRRIDPENRLDLASKTALIRIRALLDELTPLRTNFAALAIENTTAVRQFVIMAQILHHIDADSPIRMLIAECEDAQTTLAALYFARLFGIADKVDVSPLFETENALEQGERIIDAMLSEPQFRDYARLRGRIAIETGFSDAGRFVGQIPAALAIERLQGRLAETMAKHGLADVAALIFNTHGESMGRGGHPVNMADRLTWPMSAWARQRFAKAGIRTELEASFQGGDGYMFFRTPELALATLVRIAEHETKPVSEEMDPFYTQTDVSLDFYRGVRGVQRDFMASSTYARAITAFGLGLLVETGSRKARRQSDLAADRTMSLRQIRAIPHNAVLQQLGYPVNLIAGVGTAAVEDMDSIAELIAASPRGRQIMRMLRAADRLASIKSVAAYGELFNSAFWASRPYRGTEQHLEAACLALADKLTTDDRNSAFRTLTSRLRVDAVKLHRLLELIPDETPATGREDLRRSLGALQALRLALMQFIFLRAVRIPAFSRANDISRDDVLQMIFSLRIDDALAQLRRAYPVSAPSLDDYSVTEAADYPDLTGHSYASIREELIDPIEEAYSLCLLVSVAIANYFGGHG
ncbi:MAG: phosphoenolpyruvate carboxylase [Novosphingobium sp.]|nr:phosphoenolpyruvate carboxylase [Novosphingobium sp.]